MRRAVITSVCALVMAQAFGGAADLEAQVRMRNSDAQRLRSAAALESRGDYDGAEAVLFELLEERPSFSGGLFALERVLGKQNQIIRILPAIDAFLEDDPSSSGVRYLELRVLTQVDSLEAVRREADIWLETEPESEIVYREIGRAYERAFGANEALSLLRTGRDVIGPDALAMEIGDLLAATGDPLAAADEWALAVGDDAAQVSTVTRRVQGLTEAPDEAARRVVDRLTASHMLARRRAGARVALDLSVDAVALDLVRDVAGDLEGRARTTFLADAARRARDAGMPNVASWAYDELGSGASSPAERRQFDQRIIDVALAAGDTITALEAQRRVADSFSPGSVDRRRATAQVIRLESSRAMPEQLRIMLEAFRDDFPNAPEVDDLAATVAGVLQSRGDRAGASAVLEGVNGPKSSLERAYLLLADGAIEEGRSALLLALTGLPPSDATSVIQFAGLLGRLSAPGAEALANAGVKAHHGWHGEAALELAEAANTIEDTEAPVVLAEAARLAMDGEEDAIAADIRGVLIDQYPEAAEVAEASLALARYRARTPRGTDEAIRLLEDLIANRPNAAVVPGARVELQRLRGRS